MILKLIRLIRLSLTLLLVASVASAQDGKQPREGGLTGTGIVGLLNNRGVIEIGGLSVTLPAGLSVRTPLGPRYIEMMQTGEMIAVRLDGTLPDFTVVEARQVIQMIGPILSRTTETQDVLGTTVLAADIQTEARVGDWVAVSGYWREDGMVATRISIVPAQDMVHIQGTYQTLSPGLGRIGTTLVKGQIPISVTRGEVVRVSGRLEGDAVVIGSAEPGNLTQDLQTILTQGYQSTPDSTGFYTVLGTGISSVTQSPQMIDWQKLVTVCSVDGEMVPNPAIARQNGALCHE